MGVRDVGVRGGAIRLGQLLKLAGIAEDGVHAKELIEAGEVTVNGEPEDRRGRQVRPFDVVTVANEQVRVVAAD